MKNAKKIICVGLAAITASCTAMGVYAATEHWNDGSMTDTSQWSEWKEEWETVKDDYEKVALTVGADETQLNFAWYSRTVEKPKVRISKVSDMSNAAEFTGTQLTITIESLEGYYSNKVTVTVLEADTQYYYQVFKNGEWQEIQRVKTGNPDSFSFLYVGDPQIGACGGQTSSENEQMQSEIAARNDAYNWNITLENALATHPEVSFMLSAGDQVNNAQNEFEYAGYLNPSVLSSLPVSTTIGNHDSASYQYSYHFNNPNSFDINDSQYATGHTNAGTDYYYTYGDALFIIIDTNNKNCATHRNVIEKAISENGDKKWRIVMFHQDIYGSGLDHSNSDGRELRTQLTPILDENDIDVVLQGHDHTYSRSYQLSAAAGESPDNDNCYTMDSELVSGTVVDPSGTIYMEANSATGSKFYELAPEQQNYIAERSQTWTPSYSVINLTETALTITTYDVETGEILANSSPYTIVKTADKKALKEVLEAAKEKLSDGNTYTDSSLSKLNDAIANAEVVITDEQADSDKINEAAAYLNEAVSELTIYIPTVSKEPTGSEEPSESEESTESEKPYESEEPTESEESTESEGSSESGEPTESKAPTASNTHTSTESTTSDVSQSNVGNVPTTGELPSAAVFAIIAAISLLALAGIEAPELLKKFNK